MLFRVVYHPSVQGSATRGSLAPLQQLPATCVTKKTNKKNQLENEWWRLFLYTLLSALTDCNIHRLGECVADTLNAICSSKLRFCQRIERPWTDIAELYLCSGPRGECCTWLRDYLTLRGTWVRIKQKPACYVCLFVFKLLLHALCFIYDKSRLLFFFFFHWEDSSCLHIVGCYTYTFAALFHFLYLTSVQYSVL